MNPGIWALWIFAAGVAFGVCACLIVVWFLAAEFADAVAPEPDEQDGDVRVIPHAGPMPEGLEEPPQFRPPRLDPTGSGPMPVLRSDDKTGAGA